MMKRIKIIDESTKQVLTMSENSNEAWAVQNGFSADLHEVEEGYDSNTYLAGYAPVQTVEELLAIAKAEKLQAWYAYDEEYRQTATVEVDSKFFSISQDAKINLTAVSLMAVTTQSPVTYYQKNGDSETYTAEEFITLSVGIATGINNAETNFYEVEAQINNAVSVEELEGIVWGEE